MTVVLRASNSDPGALRIGLFSESFIPVQNGVTTSMLTLTAGLRARGHHVCVCAPAHHEQQPETAVLRFPSFESHFNRGYPLAYPFLPRLFLNHSFARLRFDVVHTHTPFILGLTGANLAIAHDVPLVSTYHTLYSQYIHYMPLLPDAVTQTLLEHYLLWYYSRCRQIICPSEVAARSLREQGVESPIEVIPTGIPLPAPETIDLAAREACRAAYGIPREAPLALYAGRLAQEKNLEWLLERFAAVRARLPMALLVVAGGGPDAQAIQERARTLGIAQAVRFLGPVPRQKMDTLFAAADVFCFPSPSETQGLVIGEARAAGTPCVVVDAGGAPETVTEAQDGYRVAYVDPDAFVERTVRILCDADLRAFLRKNARRNALTFTPEKMVERTLNVYARAGASPSGARAQPALKLSVTVDASSPAASGPAAP